MRLFHLPANKAIRGSDLIINLDSIVMVQKSQHLQTGPSWVVHVPLAYFGFGIQVTESEFNAILAELGAPADG